MTESVMPVVNVTVIFALARRLQQDFCPYGPY
jgi:hypothetical protein